MKLGFRGGRLAGVAVLACLALAQEPGRPPLGGAGTPNPDEPRYRQLPNGKSQLDEILKAEREQNIKDAARLVTLAQELQTEIEKTDRNVLSLSTLKKTDEIEKLARKIRGRMRHN